jgi:hypothetical protein
VVYPLQALKGYELFQVSFHQTNNFIIRFVTKEGKGISLHKDGYQQYEAYFDRLGKTSLMYLGRRESKLKNSTTRWITVVKVGASLTPLLLGLLWLVKVLQT